MCGLFLGGRGPEPRTIDAIGKRGLSSSPARRDLPVTLDQAGHDEDHGEDPGPLSVLKSTPFGTSPRTEASSSKFVEGKHTNGRASGRCG